MGTWCRAWRNYSVKRTTNDVKLIEQFVTLHKIKVWNENAEADTMATNLMIIYETAPTEVFQYIIQFASAVTLNPDSFFLIYWTQFLLLPWQNLLIECGDSTKSDCNQKDDEITPNSKVVG
jgi:hypothetical protein